MACIDEMLNNFRGKCRFRMYMLSKPRKCGLKVMILMDARSSYFYNGYVYCGKDSDGISLSNEKKTLLKPTQLVLRLCTPIVKCNRNITAYNWFSPIEIKNELKKREIHKEFKPGEANRKCYLWIHQWLYHRFVCYNAWKISYIDFLHASFWESRERNWQTWSQFFL